MSLPHILLVDDSPAILAYERAALSNDYATSIATNGAEAVRKIPLVLPDLIVLDLSMPEMDGEEVIDFCRADPQLESIPIVVVSAEHERATACLGRGAVAALPKPIRAEELLALVDRVLEEARRRRSALAILPIQVGDRRLGIPLEVVEQVLPQPACRPLAVGPFYLCEMFEYAGEPVPVLDLALRLDVPHARELVDRKMVIVRVAAGRLSLNVDEVDDPRELDTAHVTPRERFAGSSHRPLRQALVALARIDDATIPIVDPAALVSPRLLKHLETGLRDEGTSHA